MRRLKSRTHISKLVYSPDSRYLFSIGGTSTAASVWDLQAGKVVQKIYMPEYEGTQPEPITDIAFCWPNKLILAPKQRGHPLKIWEWPITNHETPTQFYSGAYRFKMLCVLDRTFLLVLNSNGGMILWNTVTHRQVISHHRNCGPQYPTDISQDGTFIAWTTFRAIEIYALSDSVNFQIEATPRTSIPIQHGVGGILRFHPFEKLIAIPYTNIIQMCDVMTGLPVTAPLEYIGKTVGLSYTPDGSKLLLLTTDGILHIWNTNTYEEIATYDFGVKSAKCLAVSPDSLTCAIGGGFLEIVIVDLE